MKIIIPGTSTELSPIMTLALPKMSLCSKYVGYFYHFLENFEIDKSNLLHFIEPKDENILLLEHAMSLS